MRHTTGERATLTPDEVAKFRAVGLSGLLLLAHILRIEPLLKDEHALTILTCLATFTDLSDPWTCSKARECAYSLSESYAASGNLSTLLTRLLRERIKPLFARTSNPAVTPQGRKTIEPLPYTATAHSDLSGEAKPWKYCNAYSVTVFRWVLSRLDVRAIIPPFLKRVLRLIKKPDSVSAGGLAINYPTTIGTDR